MAALKKFHFLFLFSLFIFGSIKGEINEEKCRWDLSICAIFQDEAPYLKEWLEFHLMAGVQHFYLYNNNSTDNYLQILLPYIKSGTVELMNWPSPIDQDWTPFQHRAYIHCLGKAIGQTRWLATIDLDEFLVPVSKPDLKAILKPFEKRSEIGGVMVFWQIYGTSFCPNISEGKLLIETLTRKAPQDYHWNRHVKTICRPATVQQIHVHTHVYKSGYLDVTTNGGGGPNQPIQVDQMRINHYWTRDNDYLFNVKLPRRKRYEKRDYEQHEIDYFIHDFNFEEDPIMLRFVPELKKRLSQ